MAAPTSETNARPAPMDIPSKWRSLPERPAAEIGLPAQVDQGGLLVGRARPGSRVWFWREPGGGETENRGRELRVSERGVFVLGVGRDDSGTIQLRVARPGPNASSEQRGSRYQIPIRDREFRIERIEGVPQDTVTPPPEIAARIAREQAAVAQARLRDDPRSDYDVRFQWPTTGRISGVYGSQRIYNGTPRSPHSGLDVAATAGTPLRAPAGGIVSFAAPDLYLTGGTVLIDHGHGVSSNFLHLSRIDVAVGQRVEAGQVIGLVGATGRATGPHMHWGMNWFDVRIDPQLLVDPAQNRQRP
jgi:murein DD-endopeptidase MepM/ murein hydrolase activator NlpD